MSSSTATFARIPRDTRDQPADPLWTEHGFALTAPQAGIVVLTVLLACLAGILFA